MDVRLRELYLLFRCYEVRLCSVLELVHTLGVGHCTLSPWSTCMHVHVHTAPMGGEPLDAAECKSGWVLDCVCVDVRVCCVCVCVCKERGEANLIVE